MKVFVRDEDASFVRRMQAAIESRRYTKIYAERQHIFHEPVNMVVSPGNSFGYMTLGFDQVYRERWGIDIEVNLRVQIAKKPLQELLVGDAIVLDTGDKDFPSLIYAPTKRKNVRIVDPVNVFLATKVALLCAIQHNAATVALPGMGTRVGQVAHDTAIEHMLNAYTDVFAVRA